MLDPFAQSMQLTQMPAQKQAIETRWFSPENWHGAKGAAAQAREGRKGSPWFRLPAHSSQTLATYEGGSGCVRRIWMTISNRIPQMLRGLRIRFFWDQHSKPAIDCPLADFFGQGLGRCSTFESALSSNPEGRSFNCCIPMPFKTGMRIELVNETNTDLEMCFYDINITINDAVDNNTLYLHALWRRQQATVFQENYEFLPLLHGRGRFLGLNAGVIANTAAYHRTWWGEGECQFFIDDDQELATLCGTGTEDYIGTAWGQGQYAHAFQGCPLADHEHYQYCFYRWHIPDPIYFQSAIRVSMHQIGYCNTDNLKLFEADGQAIYANCKPNSGPQEIDKTALIAAKDGCLFERENDDWSSCAYVYLDQAVNDFPALAPLAERVAGLHLHTENIRLDA